MNNKILISTLISASLLVAQGALAKDKHYPDHKQDHPRQNEVNKRLDNQTGRANNQAADGQITQGQANKMKAQDQKIYNQEQADKAKNGGDYLTKSQQGQLNKEENAVNREDRRDVRKDAGQTHPYNDSMAGHPRQDEVNGRLDNQTDRAKTQAADGQITSGQAKRIDNQDRAIYNQEQRDKAKNGGDYLTKGQQAQINGEENRVNREDKRDVSKDAAANGN